MFYDLRCGVWKVVCSSITFVTLYITDSVRRSETLHEVRDSDKRCSNLKDLFTGCKQ